MRQAKAIGQRGSWFAEVEGELLPCVHDHWTKNGRYHDPGAVPGERQWDDFIEAIRAKEKVILTRDNVSPDERSFERTAYVAVFAVEDVQVIGSVLTFRYTKRVLDLK